MNKVISNHTKNVKLYINLAPCSSWNLCWMQASLYTWRALISHVVCLGKTSSSWYKYSGLFLMPKILLYAQNSQCVRNSIFPNGKHIFPILWKILKFEVMEYLIPHVKFEMLVLNSTVKLKLGPKFFQFIYRFKTVFFWKLDLDCTSKFFPNSQRDFLIFECCSSWTSQLFQIHEKDGKLGFLNMSLLCTSKFSQFTKKLRNWDFEVPLILYFVRLWDSLSGTVWL